MDIKVILESGGPVQFSPAFRAGLEAVFFGILATAGERIGAIEFLSRTADQGPTGEGFGMDDVAGLVVDGSGVPEPSTLALAAVGLAALAPQRRS